MTSETHKPGNACLLVDALFGFLWVQAQILFRRGRMVSPITSELTLEILIIDPNRRVPVVGLGCQLRGPPVPGSDTNKVLCLEGSTR